MTNSLMEWHLGRDNQAKLRAFCSKHNTRLTWREHDGNATYRTYHFDNGSFIEVEVLGNVPEDEHFQVTNYGWATQ